MNVIALGKDLIGGPSNIALTSSVSCNVGATTCTIQDARILETSLIDVYVQNSAGLSISISSVTVSSGRAVLAFDALTVATSFRLSIING